MALKKVRTIPKKLREKIEAELENGEKLTWTDVPEPKFFTPGSLAGFLFFIPWTAFSSSMLFANGFDAGIIVGLFMTPFLLVGFWGLTAPIRTYREALRTIYAITNHRVITIESGRSTQIASYNPDQLGGIIRTEHNDGTADVVFSKIAWQDAEGNNKTREVGFYNIKNAKAVEKMLKAIATKEASKF